MPLLIAILAPLSQSVKLAGCLTDLLQYPSFFADNYNHWLGLQCRICSSVCSLLVLMLDLVQIMGI